MKPGIVFPQTEIGADPGGVRAFAQSSEALGFHGLMLYDHVLGADLRNRPSWNGWYDAQHMFHEIFVALGFVAAVTERIRLVTGIVILPQRQTVLVAKQAAEVDVLSGGRLSLGVAVGWNDVEYVGLNESFTNRGKRCEEQIEVLRTLWTQDFVDYEGHYHRIPEGSINPLPVQQPIPILIGGDADLVLRRAGRVGDGWMPTGTASEAAAKVGRVREYCAQHGRDASSFELVATVTQADIGFDAVEREVEAWRALGASSIYLDTMGCGLSGPDAHLEAASRFMALFES